MNLNKSYKKNNKKKISLFLITLLLIMPFVIALDTGDSNFDPSIYDNRPRNIISPEDTLPTSPQELEEPPCYGCIFNQECISFGTRLMYNEEKSYCSFQGKIKPQLSTNSECINNFECVSNICINNKCIDTSIWNKFISWFKKLFN